MKWHWAQIVEHSNATVRSTWKSIFDAADMPEPYIVITSQQGRQFSSWSRKTMSSVSRALGVPAKKGLMLSEQMTARLQEHVKLQSLAIDFNIEAASILFQLAIENCEITSVPVLAKQGLQVDVDLVDTDGRTALLVAAKNGKTEIVEMLANLGADANVSDGYGRTALPLAAENGKAETVEMLANLGADVNASSRYGQTALMLAAKNGKAKIVEMLANLGSGGNARG